MRIAATSGDTMQTPHCGVAADATRRRMFLAKADVDLPDATLRGLREADDASLGIDARILQEACDALALPRGVTPDPLPNRGTFHRLYSVGPSHVLRVAAFTGAPWTDLMAMEASLCARLRGAGLPVPACRSAALAQAESSRGAQAIDRVAGDPAGTVDDDEPAMLARLETIARFLARLHAIRGEGFGPISAASLHEGGGSIGGLWQDWPGFVRLRLEEHVGECARVGAVSGEEEARILALFRDIDFSDIGGAASLLHGDPGGHNFIFQGVDLAGVIDWEDALLGDPIFDLASLCTFQPRRRHERLLRAYGREMSDSATRRFWTYFLRIVLARTVHRHRFGYEDRPERAPASRRIQWALEELEAR